MTNPPAPSPSNRSLDRACAEKMGKEVIERLIPRTGNYQILVSADNAMTGWMNLPHYSENETAAFQLVDYATAKGYGFELIQLSGDKNVYSRFRKAGKNYYEKHEVADTRSEAICRAFLALDLSLAGEGE